jgi:hypothetical protein
MNVRLTGPPGASGLWDVVKYALEQPTWDATKRLVVLLLIICGVCYGVVRFAAQILVALLHGH